MRSLIKIFLFLAGLSALAVAVLYYSLIPDVSRLKKDNPKETSLMRYRLDEWKKKGRSGKAYQVWTPLSNISPYLAKAILIAEDDKFWEHTGFDYDAIERAIKKDLKAGKFKAGGSTISQQLAKNLYLTPEKTYPRKIKEAIITWKIERALSKKRILELYLNVVEWGDGVFGAEAASEHYFGKPSSALTPMEAARLAAVLPNPRKFDPAEDQRYVVNRSNIIYNIMIRRGIVSPEYQELTGEGPSIQSDPGASYYKVNGSAKGNDSAVPDASSNPQYPKLIDSDAKYPYPASDSEAPSGNPPQKASIKERSPALRQ